MSKKGGSVEEKLEFLLSALSLLAISTTDRLASKYCAMILKDIGELDRIKGFEEDDGEHN